MEKIGNTVSDPIHYERTYSIITGKVWCECPGFVFKGYCWHTSLEWIQKVEDFVRDLSKMSE